jgi:hypothetical protein
MREHAIPQDITGYRFHIIGNMTLKQFAEVGAGCMVGFLFYTTNLPTPVKWPFILLSAGIGAMTAFVPVEERPLDHWIVTFIHVLYKPTKFFWRRESKIPDAFLYEATTANTIQQDEVDLRPARRQRIKEYLRSVEPPKQLNAFDLNEMNQVNQIIADFSQVVVTQPVTQQQDQTLVQAATHEKPQLKVRVRSFISEYQDPNQVAVAAEPESALNLATFSFPVLQKDTNALDNNSAGGRYAQLSPSQVAQNVNIPMMREVNIQNNHLADQKDEAILPQGIALTGDRAYLEAVAPINTITSAQNVQLNTQLPFPNAPSEPNKVVGMVLTPNNDLVSNAIIEIQDATGRVARAVKSNTLGQFFITTPLESGSYTILVEKEGLQFVPLRLDLQGTALPPLEIRSVY